MERELELLLMYLQEEFQGVPEVRIRKRQPSTLTRSPDLVQDYDPEANTLHKERGIMVVARGREFYFPQEIARTSERPAVEREVRAIRDWLGIG